MSDKDVHTEHCCIYHGCKYGHTDCTVTTRKKTQSYECEFCQDREFKMEQALKWIVQQFEDNYMLDGVIVDNPCQLLVMGYEQAKEALESEDF